MFVQTSQGSFKVQFAHINSNSKYYKKTDGRDGTICRVYDVNHPETPVVSERVTRYHKDPFCRNCGRKYALTKAVHLFTKDIRKEFWKAYEKQIGF